MTVRVGLEIHQQLSTGKLFCRCPSELDEPVEVLFHRWLRATRSELGEVDAAAQEEAARGRRFEYEASGATSCLVEADEEPPHALEKEALDVSLTMALLMQMHPVDEVHVMRKVVVDGSNTSGFQRTALVALGGGIDTPSGRVSIQTLSLEEDAARPLERRADVARYRLDRLGIPLIEIATGPDIDSPQMAREVALRIGTLLRMTGRARRGIGTIRQDLNISTPDGARIEVKGVQELDLIPVAIQKEEQRQAALLQVRDRLRQRGVDRSTVAAKVDGNLVDVTSTLTDAGKGPVATAVRGGGVVLATALRGYKTLLGTKDQGPHRLGAELAGYARANGLPGILHEDELPGLGVSAAHLESLRAQLRLGPEDAIVLGAGVSATTERGLQAVVRRARLAVEGVPKETREALPDGTTRYLRPLPGGARMYPETDIPPVPVGPDRIKQLRERLPESPEARLQRYIGLGLAQDQAQALVLHARVDLFEDAVRQTGLAKEAARVILQTIPEIERDGRPVPDALVREALAGLRGGAFSKEAVPAVLRHSAQHGGSVEAAAAALGLGAVDEAHVRTVIRDIVSRNAELVRTRGPAAAGPLMGEAMKELRGKAPGETISRMLAEEIARSTRT